MMKNIALIGGRGYTGSTLLAMIEKHQNLKLAFASSNSQAGRAIQSECPEWTGAESFISLSPGEVSQHDADVWVLAVPNGSTNPWCEAIQFAHPNAIIIDLSADHRFDDDWAYGLPEHHRTNIINSKLIANPGCYATCAQLALGPLISEMVGEPNIFGVSGYSGAGKTPSPKNDPARLKDNLQPYHLCNHVHEQEISHQLDNRVRFMPHVGSFFSGITLTIALKLNKSITEDELLAGFDDFYANEPLVYITKDIPEVQAVQKTPFAHIGGFTVHPKHNDEVVLVATLDNLLKGAASQAMQNINLCLGFPEQQGIV